MTQWCHMATQIRVNDGSGGGHQAISWTNVDRPVWLMFTNNQIVYKRHLSLTDIWLKSSIFALRRSLLMRSSCFSLDDKFIFARIIKFHVLRCDFMDCNHSVDLLTNFSSICISSIEYKHIAHSYKLHFISQCSDAYTNEGVLEWNQRRSMHDVDKISHHVTGCDVPTTTAVIWESFIWINVFWKIPTMRWMSDNWRMILITPTEHDWLGYWNIYTGKQKGRIHIHIVVSFENPIHIFTVVFYPRKSHDGLQGQVPICIAETTLQDIIMFYWLHPDFSMRSRRRSQPYSKYVTYIGLVVWIFQPAWSHGHAPCKIGYFRMYDEYDTDMSCTQAIWKNTEIL